MSMLRAISYDISLILYIISIINNNLMQAKKITSGSNVLKLPKDIRKSIMVLEVDPPQPRFEDIIPHRVAPLEILGGSKRR